MPCPRTSQQMPCCYCEDGFVKGRTQDDVKRTADAEFLQGFIYIQQQNIKINIVFSQRTTTMNVDYPTTAGLFKFDFSAHSPSNFNASHLGGKQVEVASLSGVRNRNAALGEPISNSAFSFKPSTICVSHPTYGNGAKWSGQYFPVYCFTEFPLCVKVCAGLTGNGSLTVVEATLKKPRILTRRAATMARRKARGGKKRMHKRGSKRGK